MLGLTLYPGGITYADVADIAKRAETGGFDGIYFVERLANNDALAAAQTAAQATSRITVGTNIVNGYNRQPFHLAAQAMAVDEISDGRLVLGIGASHPDRVKKLGLTWQPAAEYLAETTRVLRDAFAGKAADGTPIGRTAGHEIPIHWAGVATATIEASASHADGLMMFLASEQRIRLARDLFRRAEQQAGVAAPKPISLLTPVFLSDDLSAAYEAARSYLAFYAVMNVYLNTFASSGFADEVAAMRAEEALDPTSAAPHLTDAMLDSIVVIGPPARCRERVAAFVEAGIDDPLLSPQAVEGTVADAAAVLIKAFAPN